jgi:hypothetical protein
VKAHWRSCTCGVEPEYNEKYDAAYCVGCDVWLEQNCGFPASGDCYYDCANRPVKPSGVNATSGASKGE